MAHQTEIVINGVTTAVTEFDHTAQEIDDGIDNLHNLTGGATTPQGALAALGAGVRPNLLDNAIFIGGGSQQGGGQLPVNQRGQMSYNTASGYTIDRWMHGAEPGEIELTADGVKFNGTEGTNLALAQFLDFSVSQDTVVTLSALYRGQIILDFGGATLSPSPIVESGWGLHAITYTIPAGTNLANRLYSPTIKTNGAQISYFAAVKLELGDTQTLAYQDEDGAWQLLPQPESDYVTQTLKCKRYLNVFSPDRTFPGSVSGTGNSVIITADLPVAMRTNPVISGLSGVYIRSVEGQYGPISDISANGIHIYDNQVIFQFTNPNTSRMPAGTPLAMFCKNQWIMSAEL